ncbi:MAG: thiamine-phosphate kinase [Actinomycetota bacterium]|nr:thiamine-phosphate kinase [Actinomycetota bacterium]
MRITSRFPRAPADAVWSGDDAAVVDAGTDLVVTVDMLVEGVDFDLTWATGDDIGYKVMAVNASDIAAMGAAPRHAVATLALPPATALELVDGIAAGLALAAERFGCALVGGDISRASEISMSLTMTGVLFGKPVLRSGARPGDALCVTGSLGGAAAGLAALRRRNVGATAVRAEIDSRSGADGLAVLAARQLRPVPRLEAAAVLAGAATAMIDISDGLALDLARLLRASGCGCAITSEAIPIDPDLVIAASSLSLDPLTTALTGGEDFELLVALPPDRVENAQMALDESGTPLTPIGTTTDGAETIDGAPLARFVERGWDHLQAR